MGLGPPVIELYRQLKLQGAFNGVDNVMELGSQDFWCPQKNLLKALLAAFGRNDFDPLLLETSNASQKPARLLYEALGIAYNCVDIDGRSGTLVLDLNFDPLPPEHHGKYGLVTNHGTSEHILNQYNIFKLLHDLTKVGGVMIHAVPFTVHLEHGFFNYQPNFFEALARYNSYETLGLWVGPDWQLASFIPWDPILLDYLAINSKTTHLLVAAHRKMYDRKFCVPFQEIYESYVPDEIRSRYSMVIDGEVMDGKRVKHLTKDEILGKEYKTEITGLNNWIAAYKGQIDGLKHELAVTKYQFDQMRYGRPLDEHVAALNQQLEEMRAAIAELEKIRAANAELQRRLCQMELERADVGKLRADNERLQQQIETLTRKSIYSVRQL